MSYSSDIGIFIGIMIFNIALLVAVGLIWLFKRIQKPHYRKSGIRWDQFGIYDSVDKDCKSNWS